MPLYAFDGTWNKEYTDPETFLRNTNVRRFYDLYEGTKPRRYISGVGTRLGIVGRIVGGVFGAGGFARLDEMYDTLCRNYIGGHDKINIIGFSRGGALAMAFANKVARQGIREPDGAKRVVQPTPTIDFIGVWDVVGSFGFAVNVGPLKFQEWNLGYELQLPGNIPVRHCYHALALDERRQTFRETRIASAYEVWFSGAHSDVGGGNGNRGLNDITLRWMAFKAMAAGLPGFTEPRILEATAGVNPKAPVSPPEQYDFIRDDFRPLGAGDRFHHAVAAARREGFNPTRPDMLVESAIDERLAAGVVV
jgi:uncharacterized protein (DUF2235 family)